MNEILIPVLIVAGIGLIAGILLATASIIMAVPKDEKAESVLELLPGANCGACGYSGCSGYAEALAKGEAKPGLCSPGGAETASKIAALLGEGDGTVEYKAALVHCTGSYDYTADKMIYDGIERCAAAAQLAGGTATCRFGCMGLGDCVKVCPYHAITVCNGLASIDPARCRGCSLCVAVCPKKLISLVPVKPQAVVRCASCEKGAVTNKVCKIGCIGCMKCTKVCETGAIKIDQFHATVDAQVCTACGKCVETCPRNCIALLFLQPSSNTEKEKCTT